MNTELIAKLKELDISQADNDSLISAAHCMIIIYDYKQINLGFDTGCNLPAMMSRTFNELHRRASVAGQQALQAALIRTMSEIADYLFDDELQGTLSKDINSLLSNTTADGVDIAYLQYQESKYFQEEEDCFLKIIDNWIAQLDEKSAWQEISTEDAFRRIELVKICLGFSGDSREAAFKQIEERYKAATDIETATVSELAAMSAANFAGTQRPTEYEAKLAAAAHRRHAKVATPEWWHLQEQHLRHHYITAP